MRMPTNTAKQHLDPIGRRVRYLTLLEHVLLILGGLTYRELHWLLC